MLLCRARERQGLKNPIPAAGALEERLSVGTGQTPRAWV